MKMKLLHEISYLPLGGGPEIGASCYCYKFGEDRVLVFDAGLRPVQYGSTLNASNIRLHLPNFDLLDRLDDVVITHEHYDHGAGLVILHKRFPKARVWMTEKAKDFLKIHLLDLAWRMDRTDWGTPCPYAFSKDDVEQLYEKIRIIPEPLNTDETVVPFISDSRNQFYAVAYNMGHVPGAIGIACSYYGKTTFHTGDMSMRDQFFTPGARKIVAQDGIDFLNCEGTYASSIHGNQDNERANLMREVKETYAQGGNSLIPTLPFRGQEIWAYLYTSGFPMDRVFFDGSIIKQLPVFNKHFPFSMLVLAQVIEGGHFGGKAGKNSARDALLNEREPFVIIGSGAALQEESAAGQWMPKLLDERSDTLIALTSYADKCSEAASALDQIGNDDDHIHLFGRTYPKGNKRIKKFNLSAHIDGAQIKLLKQGLGPKVMAFHHGEESQVLPRIEKWGRKKGNCAFLYPKNGEEVVVA